MHTLNEQTRQALNRRLGKCYEEVTKMSAEELDTLVESRIGKKTDSGQRDEKHGEPRLDISVL